MKRVLISQDMKFDQLPRSDQNKCQAKGPSKRLLEE